MPKYQPEEYWEKRSLERLTSAEKSSIQYLKKIQSTYRSAARSVVNTVKETYASYYRNDETFSQELLEEIEPRGNITKFLNDMAKAGLDTSLPENFKGRMNRLKMLEAQLWAESKKVAIQEQNISTKSYEKTLTNTYYRTIYDIANGTGIDSPFSMLNQRTIEKILETKFEGSNYSERIWKNTDILANSLQDILARAVATGQAPEKTIREVMERFDVGFSNASRLVRTETNYFENKAELESYKELGIKEFQFVATLDERTSDVCRSMDHKKFKVKDAEQGKNVPPLHPYCRSTIVPVVEGFEPKERSARNEEGEIYLAENQPYNKWMKQIQQTNKRIVAGGGIRPTEKLADAQIISKIGVTPEYWKEKMVSNERAFARSYAQEHDITWIDKMSRKDPETGLPLETNDYKSTYTQWELKTPAKKPKYASIANLISRAAKKGYKKNFMINLGNRRLSSGLAEKLSNYNLTHSVKIKRIHVWSRGEEITIKLKK